ncbi:hypothetical protein KFK09_002501 [Dendrobium nobile]|uniref:Uncharacterized protein n=1 Tax=Dendrobium nobile TaxID=94219 RepID=A0A8T3C3W1_DENNO|nr:hypothetical protein KFK09_002501 [Dendrobium nobile]
MGRYCSKISVLQRGFGADELYSVACNPTDASLVATGGKDDREFMWKVGSQDSSLELQDELYSVECSPTDASLVATGGKDDRGFMWKVGLQDSGLELQCLLT